MESANGGFSQAQYLLGVILYTGKMCSKDIDTEPVSPIEGKKFLRAAMEQGHKKAAGYYAGIMQSEEYSRGDTSRETKHDSEKKKRISFEPDLYLKSCTLDVIDEEVEIELYENEEVERVLDVSTSKIRFE